MAPFTVNPQRFDPYKNFKFRVKWDGRYVAGFNQASELSPRTEDVENRENAGPSNAAHSPAHSKHEAITLERGVTHDPLFDQWANKVWHAGSGADNDVTQQDARRDVAIEVRNEANQLVLAYKVFGCWISAYQAQLDLDANANAVAIAHLRLENEGWTRDDAIAHATEPALAMRQAVPDGLAQRLVPAASWDDLILPEPQLAVLHEIAAELRQRTRTQHDSGSADAQPHHSNMIALFVGESGTGKTMAAEVMARESGRELYRIDLSAVANKYLGETEKNLCLLFEAAEARAAILMFDEADALLGKRTEVKDAHDRFATLDCGAVLQRMEAYGGLIVLSTNQKSNLDSALLRRLRFVVQLPFPDLDQRARIWRRVFPAAIPNHELDARRLARLNLTGGSIRNVALSAASLAADAGTEVTMTHVLQAAHAEAARREQPLSDAETRDWP